MEIYEIVKKIREEKNFSQEYVASQLSLSQSQYCRREKGKVKFLADEILKLSIIFEVSLFALYNVDNNSMPLNNNILIFQRLVDQLEERLKEKDEIIALLKRKG